MAACTLALSPSSAKVAVCKRTFLRASSHGPTLAQRITGAASATESAGVTAAKGLTGKRKARGNEAMKAIPCARQLTAQWHNSRASASTSRDHGGIRGGPLCRGRGAGRSVKNALRPASSMDGASMDGASMDTSTEALIEPKATRTPGDTRWSSNQPGPIPGAATSLWAPQLGALADITPISIADHPSRDHA